MGQRTREEKIDATEPAHAFCTSLQQRGGRGWGLDFMYPSTPPWITVTETPPQRGIAAEPSCEADDLLAESVTHEEHRVFGDVGHQGRGGSLVEAPQPHLSVGGRDAIYETTVHIGEGLHLDLRSVQRVPAEDTCSAPWWRE